MFAAVRTSWQKVPSVRDRVQSALFKCSVAEPSAAPAADPVPQPDKLYRRLSLEVRGHDPAVLKSYQKFVVTSARYLDVPFVKSWEPPKVHERRTMLRSAFAKKKYLEQYEVRTYFQVIDFEKLTGSTAETFLEYIERNIPEGVAMKVTKHEIEPLPEYLRHKPAE